MTLNELGGIVVDSWKAIPKFFAGIRLDSFVVMPNHLHGLIRLSENNKWDLIQIIRNFKSITSRKIRTSYPNLNIWQKGFYDRIVRTERELNLIRLYIDLNPAMWDEKKELSEIDFRSEDDLADMLEPYRKF